MDIDERLQAMLREALRHQSVGCPPRLAHAMAEAVLVGGARLRPQLCLAVAAVDTARCAPGRSDVWLAASAIELLHCASLVHDDLPCFDDASVRRGRPSIHARFGEASAVLVGDGLIMTAFAQLGRLSGPCALDVQREIAQAAKRMVWGQALEDEPHPDLQAYHGHKTAALFEAAAVCGARLAICLKDATANAATLETMAEAWRAFGSHIGGLYQMADDILDVARADDCSRAPKSAGRDRALGRPNAALQMGLHKARLALEVRLQHARRAIVRGPQEAYVSAWFDGFVARLNALSGLWQHGRAERLGVGAKLATHIVGHRACAGDNAAF